MCSLPFKEPKKNCNLTCRLLGSNVGGPGLIREHRPHLRGQYSDSRGPLRPEFFSYCGAGAAVSQNGKGTFMTLVELRVLQHFS